jgi:hypothetical protein
LSPIDDHYLDLKILKEIVSGFFGLARDLALHDRPNVVQTYLEFLPSQKFASVSIAAGRGRPKKIPKAIMAVVGAKLF